MAEPKTNELMEKVVSLCKRKGFIFQSSEIYGGINGFWDYGPLGAELKRNVKELWWNCMTRMRDDVVGLEATIIMHPQIWKASGHVDTFADLMRECPLTRKRVRADQVDPESGNAWRFTGARTASGWSVEKPFGILLNPGDHPESARKRAREFYAQAAPDPAVKDPPLSNCSAKPWWRSRIPWISIPKAAWRWARPGPSTSCSRAHYGPLEATRTSATCAPKPPRPIFAQFKNVMETSRQQVPFGIGQIGKAFRNEVTPRNYTFRSREFEQMELEFFIKPDEAVEAISGSVTQVGEGHPGEPKPTWGWQAWHKYWVEERIRFYEEIGLPRTMLVEYWQKPEELAHYARACVDILFKFPFGTQELEGIAARSDFDLSQHERFSGKSMGVFDEELRATWGKLDPARQQEIRQRYYDARYKYLTKAGVAEDQAARTAKENADGLAKGQYIPHVIEPSAGVDRLILAILCHAYHEEQVTDEKGKVETRVVMKFHPRLAPVKVGIFPLLKNKPELVKKALEVRDLLRPHMTVFYDEAGAIGRRYRRQDESGTPFGLTIDFDTLGVEKPELGGTVTLRERDSMTQTRININELLPLLLSKIR